MNTRESKLGRKEREGQNKGFLELTLPRVTLLIPPAVPLFSSQTVGRWPWCWDPSSMGCYCGANTSLGQRTGSQTILAMRQGSQHEKAKSEERRRTVVVISIHSPGFLLTWRASTEGLFCPHPLDKFIFCLFIFKQGKDTNQRLSFVSLALLWCNWNQFQSLEEEFQFQGLTFCFHWTGDGQTLPCALPGADPQLHVPCFPTPPQPDSGESLVPGELWEVQSPCSYKLCSHSDCQQGLQPAMSTVYFDSDCLLRTELYS